MDCKNLLSFAQLIADDDEVEEFLFDEFEEYLLNAHRKTHGGSSTGRRVINRERQQENPTYNDELFRRRFRMRRSLFLPIVEAVAAHDEYFMQKRDAAMVLGLSPLQSNPDIPLRSSSVAPLSFSQ